VFVAFIPLLSLDLTAYSMSLRLVDPTAANLVYPPRLAANGRNRPS